MCIHIYISIYILVLILTAEHFWVVPSLCSFNSRMLCVLALWSGGNARLLGGQEVNLQRFHSAGRQISLIVSCDVFFFIPYFSWFFLLFDSLAKVCPAHLLRKWFLLQFVTFSFNSIFCCFFIISCFPFMCFPFK